MIQRKADQSTLDKHRLTTFSARLPDESLYNASSLLRTNSLTHSHRPGYPVLCVSRTTGIRLDFRVLDPDFGRAQFLRQEAF